VNDARARYMCLSMIIHEELCHDDSIYSVHVNYLKKENNQFFFIVLQIHLNDLEKELVVHMAWRKSSHEQYKYKNACIIRVDIGMYD
jgi:hypothetical protein